MQSSTTGNEKVMAYITPNYSDSSYYDLYIQGDGKSYANSDSSFLFSGFENVDSIRNIEAFDTSKVTNMSSMFYSTGRSSKVFKLDCRSWNVDKVTSYGHFNVGVTSKVTPLNWVN